MTPEMNFNQKNRRKFMCMRERERQKGIGKGQEIKKIDLFLEEKKEV